MKFFYKQAAEEKANFGTYVLTVAIVILALIVGQVVSELIARTFFGFSLLFIPDSISKNIVLSLLILPFVFAVLALIAAVKWIHKRNLIGLFTSRSKFDWKRFSLSALIWLFILGLLLVYGYSTQSTIELNFDGYKFLGLLLVCLLLLPFQTAAEDLFFRAFLFQGLARLRIHPLIIVLLLGVLFGYSHIGNPEIEVLGLQVLIYYIMTGIFMGLLSHLDNGMELSMGFHFANNLFGALILTNDWQAFQTDALFIDRSEPIFGWDSVLLIAVIQPLLLWLYSKLYNWKNSRVEFQGE